MTTESKLLLQDSICTTDGRHLSQWFASKLDARKIVREVAKAIIVGKQTVSAKVVDN